MGGRDLRVWRGPVLRDALDLELPRLPVFKAAFVSLHFANPPDSLLVIRQCRENRGAPPGPARVERIRVGDDGLAVEASWDISLGLFTDVHVSPDLSSGVVTARPALIHHDSTGPVFDDALAGPPSAWEVRLEGEVVLRDLGAPVGLGFRDARSVAAWPEDGEWVVRDGEAVLWRVEAAAVALSRCGHFLASWGEERDGQVTVRVLDESGALHWERTCAGFDHGTLHAGGDRLVGRGTITVVVDRDGSDWLGFPGGQPRVDDACDAVLLLGVDAPIPVEPPRAAPCEAAGSAGTQGSLRGFDDGLVFAARRGTQQIYSADGGLRSAVVTCDAIADSMDAWQVLERDQVWLQRIDLATGGRIGRWATSIVGGRPVDPAVGWRLVARIGEHLVLEKAGRVQVVTTEGELVCCVPEGLFLPEATIGPDGSFQGFELRRNRHWDLVARRPDGEVVSRVELPKSSSSVPELAHRPGRDERWVWWGRTQAFRVRAGEVESFELEGATRGLVFDGTGALRARRVGRTLRIETAEGALRVVHELGHFGAFAFSPDGSSVRVVIPGRIVSVAAGTTPSGATV